jgi:hypothetical protein
VLGKQGIWRKAALAAIESIVPKGTCSFNQPATHHSAALHGGLHSIGAARLETVDIKIDSIGAARLKTSPMARLNRRCAPVNGCGDQLKKPAIVVAAEGVETSVSIPAARAFTLFLTADG